MKTKRKFSHLDWKKRDRLQALLDEGVKQVEIANILNVDKSTISRELSKWRKKNRSYDATVAERRARLKRDNSKYQGMKIEHDPALRIRIIEMLKEKRSPDEIAGRLNKEFRITLGKNAIYKWLYSSYGQPYCRYLCTRRYKPRPQSRSSKREVIPDRIHISQRPKTKGLIHFEGDTAVSPQMLKSRHAAAFAVEISSNLMLARRVDNLQSATVSNALRSVLSKVRADTLTLDNGIENARHRSIGIPSFFCDPHAPWQKPHVEQGIGLLRRWFVPKGTDWKAVSEEDLQRYVYVLNSKYRKKLGYRSAYEVAIEKGILKTLPEGVAFGTGI